MNIWIRRSLKVGLVAGGFVAIGTGVAGAHGTPSHGTPSDNQNVVRQQGLLPGQTGSLGNAADPIGPVLNNATKVTTNVVHVAAPPPAKVQPLSKSPNVAPQHATSIVTRTTKASSGSATSWAGEKVARVRPGSQPTSGSIVPGSVVPGPGAVPVGLGLLTGGVNGVPALGALPAGLPSLSGLPVLGGGSASVPMVGGGLAALPSLPGLPAGPLGLPDVSSLSGVTGGLPGGLPSLPGLPGLGDSASGGLPGLPAGPNLGYGRRSVQAAGGPGVTGPLDFYTVVPTGGYHEVDVLDTDSFGLLGAVDAPVNANVLTIDSGNNVQNGDVTQIDPTNPVAWLQGGRMSLPQRFLGVATRRAGMLPIGSSAGTGGLALPGLPGLSDSGLPSLPGLSGVPGLSTLTSLPSLPGGVSGLTAVTHLVPLGALC